MEPTERQRQAIQILKSELLGELLDQFHQDALTAFRLAGSDAEVLILHRSLMAVENLRSYLYEHLKRITTDPRYKPAEWRRPESGTSPSR